MRKSDFAKLKDKVALLFSEKPYVLNNIDKAWDVHYLLKNSFSDCLDVISATLAHQPGDMHESLRKAWLEFQSKLPDLYVKTTHIVDRMQKRLAEG